MRLIDADALKLSHCKECTLYPDKCLGENCDWDSIAHINMMPTVDAEPVRHGRWKEYDDDYGDTYECTSCGELFCMIEGTPIENGYDYCPKCGAKMDEVE